MKNLNTLKTIRERYDITLEDVALFYRSELEEFILMEKGEKMLDLCSCCDLIDVYQSTSKKYKEQIQTEMLDYLHSEENLSIAKKQVESQINNTPWLSFDIVNEYQSICLKNKDILSLVNYDLDPDEQSRSLYMDWLKLTPKVIEDLLKSYCSLGLKSKEAIGNVLKSEIDWYIDETSKDEFFTELANNNPEYML